MNIGVLALQGDFREHMKAVGRLGTNSTPVRDRSDLSTCDGLIIPGGESTAISRLLNKWDMFEPLKRKAKNGFPLFGTCAGIILLASEVEGSQVPTLGALNITVRRNGYGRQIDSFEADLAVDGAVGETVRGVFIRAPQITEIGEEVQILAEHEEYSVLVRQENVLGATFHPELTESTDLHRYFVRNVVTS